MVEVKAKYEVYPVQDEELVRTVCTPSKGGGFEYKEVKETRKCFDVYFPGGHSMRVRGEDELRRLGFDRPPDLVDMETGDVVSKGARASLKEQVERQTKPSKPKG